VHIVEALEGPVNNSGSKGAELFVNMGKVFWADFFLTCQRLIFRLYRGATPEKCDVTARATLLRLHPHTSISNRNQRRYHVKISKKGKNKHDYEK
jgi:hypothetical protein